MKLEKTDVDGLLMAFPERIHDDRGYFQERFSCREFYDLSGVEFVPSQFNESFSVKNTCRGLHYQCGKNSQAKVVWVSDGIVEDFVVDMRKGSPTFMSVFHTTLSGSSRKMLFIPKGMAHGFMAVTDCRFCYLCDSMYDPSSSRTVWFFDEALKICCESFIDGPAIMSGKDRNGTRIGDVNFGEVL